jgi:hypothetical protein
VKDVKILKYEYSLPEFIKLKEYVEIMDDVEKSAYKDSESKHKLNQRK